MSNLGEQFRDLESVQFSSGTVHVLFVPETLQLFLLSPAGAAASSTGRSPYFAYACCAGAVWQNATNASARSRSWPLST